MIATEFVINADRHLKITLHNDIQQKKDFFIGGHFNFIVWILEYYSLDDIYLKYFILQTKNQL